MSSVAGPLLDRSSGSLLVGVANTNTNTAAVVGTKVWHLTPTQMCYFDSATAVGVCEGSWTMPADGSGAGMTTDGQDLYVIMRNNFAYKFDVSDALISAYPWSALPPMLYNHDSYPGAAYRGGWLYALGGTPGGTTRIERLHIETGATEWEDFGTLPRYALYSAYVRLGQIVYAISGEQNGSYTNQVMALDVESGSSGVVSGLLLATPRYYMGAATAGGRSTCSMASRRGSRSP